MFGFPPLCLLTVERKNAEENGRSNILMISSFGLSFLNKLNKGLPDQHMLQAAHLVEASPSDALDG